MAISDITIGIILAFIAMVSWGFGDFFIQKSTIKIGDWETLFFISIIGVIIVTPFIWSSVPALFANLPDLLLLLVVSVLLLAAALFDFESLRQGKIAIIEPIYALEIPVAGLLAFLILNETVTLLQLGLIIGIVVGLVLVSLRKFNIKAKHLVERGVILAVIGTIFMGMVNFGFGVGSRATSALLTNWFADLFLAVITVAYILYKKRHGMVLFHFKHNKKVIFRMSILDKIAWVSFAGAMVLAPIVIVVPLSESYIILTVLLGVIINREKINRHQTIGLVIGVGCAILLAASII